MKCPQGTEHAAKARMQICSSAGHMQAKLSPEEKRTPVIEGSDNSGTYPNSSACK